MIDERASNRSTLELSAGEGGRFLAELVSDTDEFGSGALSYVYLIEFLAYPKRAYFATPDDIRRDVTENEKTNEVVAYINDNTCTIVVNGDMEDAQNALIVRDIAAAETGFSADQIKIISAAA